MLRNADTEAEARLERAAAEVDRLRTRADAEIQAKRDDSEATWETISAVKRSEAAVIAESRVAAVDTKELAAEAWEKAVTMRERTAETMMATMRARLADAEGKVADARAKPHAAEDKVAAAENLLAQARIRFQESAAEAADLVQSSHAALAESFQQEMVRKQAAADAEAESVRESMVAAQTRRDRELDFREAQLEERSSSIDLEGRLSSIVAQVSQESRGGEDGEDGQVDAGQSAPQNPRPRFSQWDDILVPLSEILRHIPLTRANVSVRSVIFKVAPFLSYPRIADIMMREVDKVLPEPVSDRLMWMCWFHLAHWAEDNHRFMSTWQPHIITGTTCGHCRRPHQCLRFALVDEGGETRYQFRLASDEVQT
ncbi:hypothetical protein D7B24_003305 [Verticillium nonalfalfae]|uniref:Uncharacterized protein n=1 Tax=Verticillium nonalfalfae TaxID=1051616 RepID=A0A3M9XXQ8_9PEZI|nr:uncharacterized protein D7B24_003305 [Verticillium nonalfalfae]RNJ52562.1 hypothetical protein D7B24_003305 [Verticillium nonalfalfae]